LAKAPHDGIHRVLETVIAPGAEYHLTRRKRAYKLDAGTCATAMMPCHQHAHRRISLKQETPLGPGARIACDQ
jgi:hypothetical protein